LKILSTQGVARLLPYLRQLGARHPPVLASHVASGTDDPWARGGYAYFDPTFAPALRPWLSRVHGRCVFAGEHTSHDWQGSMNGAVESGLRAASEVRALSSI
jgi:monoamine oxidase